MDIARKCLRQCGQIPSGRSRGKFLGQCWRNAAKRFLQIIHQARDNHLHIHPPATHICGAGWLCRWRGNASIGTAHLPHNTLRGQVPVSNECRGKILEAMRADSYGNATGKFGGNAVGMPHYRSDLTSSYMSPHAFAICFTELLNRLFRTFARRIL